MDKVFTDKDAELFNSLGFEWDRSVLPKNVPEHGVALACSSLQDILATYVFDASYLEGNRSPTVLYSVLWLVERLLRV